MMMNKEASSVAQSSYHSSLDPPGPPFAEFLEGLVCVTAHEAQNMGVPQQLRGITLATPMHV